MKIPFLSGDFYSLDDPDSETAQLINLYPEVGESGQAQWTGRLRGTPGLELFIALAAQPVRGLWMGNGRLFAVGGSKFYEVWGDGYYQEYGDVGDDDTHSRVKIFANGNEAFVVSAGYAWRVWGDALGAYHVDHVKLIAAEYTDLGIGVKAFYYDLTISATDNTKVSSQARPFVSGDVGLSLVIADYQTGWTHGTYTISAVSSGVATLSGAVGTVGSTDGTGQLLDGSNLTVNSPTIPFQASDVGGTLVVPDPAATGWTPGTYQILSVADGIATLNASPGSAGTLDGIATQYPGEGPATDADGNLKAATGAYIDGYAVVAPPIQPKVLSNTFYINDPSTGGFDRWLALDKGTKEGQPDNILELLADHEELYIFGDLQSTEVWRDTGAANFPFERDMGAFLHFGLCAKDSVVQLGTSGVAWLAWSAERGAPEAWYSVGFQPQRVSTHALENQWATYPTVRDAAAYSYIEDGHHFWVLHFPSANVSWAYDLTASQQLGKKVWHARTWWDGTQHRRQRQWVHTYGYFLKGADHQGPDWTHGLSHFVGDWENGNIYVQNLGAYDDAGDAIRREILSPHMAQENQRINWNLFQLQCAVGGGNDVTWTLDYSNDRGHTFIASRDRSAAGNGARNQRLRWWKCGTSWDRVWRLVSMSKALISITAAWFDASESGG